MALNKPVVNKKLGMKMKETGLMNKLLRVLGDNSDMRKVLCSLVEKGLKDSVLVPNRDSKIKFYQEYVQFIDQGMVDGTVMPSLVKLLRRGETNVTLLLEYLECHH